MRWNGRAVYTWRRVRFGAWAPGETDGSTPIAEIVAPCDRPENDLFLFPDLKNLPRALDFYFPCDRAEFLCPIFGLPFRFQERHRLLRRMTVLRVAVTLWTLPQAVRDELLWREALVPFCNRIVEVRKTP